MKSYKTSARYRAAFVIAGVSIFSLLALTGCGSGGGTAPAPGAAISNSGGIELPVTGGVITRATENTLTDDAKVLATREATGAFVSLDTARVFDGDLATIRAAYPGVTDVHARLTFEPKTLLVIVKSSAPWIGKWQASSSAAETTTDADLTTGEATLDALLKKYDPTRTTAFDPYNGTQTFALHFPAALIMLPVASEFASSSPNITVAEVNSLIGDGDNVVFSTNSSGEKVYAFSQGYGDCPSGCTNHYTRTYTLLADGTITEQTEGTPQPAPLIVGQHK